jgi:hypothetical protein
MVFEIREFGELEECTLTSCQFKMATSETCTHLSLVAAVSIKGQEELVCGFTIIAMTTTHCEFHQ